MASSTLSVGCGGYDRIRPLQDGRVSVEGCALDVQVMTPAAVVAASFGSGALDLAEVSTGGLAMRLDQGKADYVGVPAFVSMAFRHDCLYVPGRGPARGPRDLAGARIGIGDFAGTTGIWLRGMLQDLYGLDLRSVGWVFGPVEMPAGPAAPPALPDGFRGSAAPADRSLVELMASGELDVLVSHRVPKPFAARDGSMKRLFPDLEAAEAEYARAFGCLPALHLMALKAARAEADPALPARLLAAFTRAKDLALASLRDTSCYHASLPSLIQAVERAEAALGADFFAYGLERHRASIDAFCRYCHEQGLTRRRLSAAELFPHFA